MSTSTCCACRWAGTLANHQVTCPGCGEQCFHDGVRFVKTFEGPNSVEPPAGTPLTPEERAENGLPPLEEGTDDVAIAYRAALSTNEIGKA